MKNKTYLFSVASRTTRRAAWLESSVVWPGWWAFSRCSANATLIEGRTSAGKG